MASEGVAHKALIKNSSKFKESGLDPKKLASVLYKKELITPEAYAKTTDTNSTASDEEKLEILYNNIDENTLVEDGYFDRFINCLMNDIKDERCTAVAQSIKSSYEDMVAQRKDIAVGVKHRLSDAAKYVKKKAAQAHEGVRAFSYAVGDIIAKDKVEGSFEEDSDLHDTQNEEDESQKEEVVKSEDESSDAYRCLYCSKTINQEEEPVHRACLPNYPLCIRCLQNGKKDSSYYCEQCLEYEQVSICHYCSGETNGIPVHFSCLENYPWCLRCMTQKREGAKYLCKECKPENIEDVLGLPV
ncbi:PREDICTED: uncharacterized protein LOC109582979 [Amphimedon queenslandica]|uniref:Uncharacterized protein n=1 Tax=Amphimedon queenslandica TaxID=400682 RepID=A0AAN0J9C1_AMPQE|nr:PREDICTED: uncharacterized protein LOC109582979 [Amphimedon queenslandica]|eukprot:XP_019853640.1 PREDICTED: uncharacterized protein LOC109582979 [Amphimedon queenslandica]